MKLVVFALCGLLSVPALAQDERECLAGEPCPRPTLEAYPETGIWFNPEEPGSGFTFEVQNGTLAGYYFGYDGEGSDAWFLISGQLELVEENGVIWRLTAPLFRFQGGSCIGCPYQDPGDPDSLETVILEFTTRATAKFSVDGSTWHRIQAFTYGTGGRAVFPTSDYPMPNLDGQWLMIVYDRELEIETSRPFAALGTDVWLTTGDARSGSVYYSIDQAQNPPEYHFIADIECVTAPGSAGGTCTLSMAQPPMEAKEFYMPATAITDSYFRAVADDGDTFEAFRVNYD